MTASPTPRRTFAIISHPDAGKTTLTEKLLLYGGAIHLAGSVKARRAARHATSDWMALEQQRGISVTSSVLQFEYLGYQVNLLDTPGHADFSEDTYRTLIAADSAVMLLDNRRGVEERTRQLFDVCQLRRMPIFTFVNKCDRPGGNPLAADQRRRGRPGHRHLSGHLADSHQHRIRRRGRSAAPRSAALRQGRRSRRHAGRHATRFRSTIRRSATCSGAENRDHAARRARPARPRRPSVG